MIVLSPPRHAALRQVPCTSRSSVGAEISVICRILLPSAASARRRRHSRAAGSVTVKVEPFPGRENTAT